MWIVTLYSNTTQEPILVKRGLDKRPLRFTEKRYAEQSAHDSNQNLKEFMKIDNLCYIVMEDNFFYEKDIEVTGEEDL